MRSQRSKGLASGDELHPVQAALSSMTDFNAAIARLGKFVRRVALLHEGHANNDDEIREWMSGNICRCGAYPNILAAIKRSEDEGWRMNPFTYSRATDANQAVTAVSGKPQSKFLGGGTNLIDLMKMGVETPNGFD